MKRRQDEGVSTVVSAVLVFSLIVLVLSVYSSTIVPDRVSNAEAQHLRGISASMGNVAAEILGSINLQREGEFTSQFDLGTNSVFGLSVFRSSGSLSVRENAFFANFLCSSPRLLARDASAAPGSVHAAIGSPTVIEFHGLSALEFRVSNYVFATQGSSSTTARVFQASNPVGTLSLAFDQASQSARVESFDAESQPVFSQTLVAGQPSVDSLIVDALEPQYGLSSLLGDTQGPFRMELTSSTSAVTAYAVYEDERGIVGVLGQGRDLTSGFQRTVTPASLVYRSDNSRFPDQTYSLEGGAVALDQANGQHLTLVPFDVLAAGGARQLRLTMLNLTGAGHVTGTHAVVVSALVRDPSSSVLECSNPTLLVHSEHPYAWQSAWIGELLGEGLDPTQVTLSGTIVTVRLTGDWTVVLHESRVLVRLA